jgi:hypothetical protein
MLVTTAGAEAPALPLTPPAKAQATSPQTDPPAAAATPADSVSLSPAAQAALTAPAPPTGEALRNAADLLNNATGKAAVADQIDAYALIAGYVADGKNFDAPKDIATTIIAGAALYDSDFARRQQGLLNAVNTRMLTDQGGTTANSVRDGLAVFNGFSADDQQIYLGAVNLQTREAGAPGFASADAYRASLQAQADALGPPSPNALHVYSSVGAAAPDGATLMAALVTVNDDSGRMAVKDQLAAYDLLTGYASSSKDRGPARDAVLKSFQGSPFATHVASVEAQMNSPVLSADVGRTLLDRINRLSPDDQQIAFHGVSQAKPGAFATLDSLKANDQARSDILKVTNKIFAKFGGDDLTKITDPRLTRNPAFQALLDLMKDDPASDGWTVRARQVLSDLAKSLDLTPDDPKAAERAKALATLKAPPPVEAGQAMAFKAMKQITDNLQKARDDRTADATGRPHTSATTDADKAARHKLKKGEIDWTVATAPPPAAYAPGATLDTAA